MFSLPPKIDRVGSSPEYAAKKYYTELPYQYKSTTLESLVTGKLSVGTVEVQVLRGATIEYDTASSLYLPKYSYWLAEKELASSLDTSQDRVHRSLIRLLKNERYDTKPHYITQDAPGCMVSTLNVVYAGQLHINCSKYLRALVKDLATRRPYINTARVVYDTYSTSYFARLGLIK